MNLCIKTGADLWVESHGAYYHGDAFLVAGTFMFHHTGALIYEHLLSREHQKLSCRYVLDDSDLWTQQGILYLESAKIIACDNLLIQEQL